MLNFVLPMLLVLLAPLMVSSQEGPGPCHPYPGAVSQDCLQLIRDNLGNYSEILCQGPSRRATLTLGLCSITTKCVSSELTVIPDEIVRRALTSIGACALSDYGSISGYYVAENGDKTCYLYPGRENQCS